MCIRDRGLDDLRAFAGSLNREIEPFILDVRTGNGVLDVLLTEKRRQCLGAGTVSYTHLDVYKRQAWGVASVAFVTMSAGAAPGFSERVASTLSARSRCTSSCHCTCLLYTSRCV